MHAHDFKIVYKGNKGIALQCIHCGQPARLRPKYDRTRKIVNFFLYTPLLLSCHDVKESLDRIWIFSVSSVDFVCCIAVRICNCFKKCKMPRKIL